LTTAIKRVPWTLTNSCKFIRTSTWKSSSTRFESCI